MGGASETWGEICSDFLNRLTARKSKVCKAVITASEGFFDESKDEGQTHYSFILKLIWLKALVFLEKHVVFRVTPNFRLGVYR